MADDDRETELFENPLDLEDFEFDLEDNPRRRRRSKRRRSRSRRRSNPAPRRRRRSRRRSHARRRSNPIRMRSAATGRYFSMRRNPSRRRRYSRRRRNPAIFSRMFGSNSPISEGIYLALGAFGGDLAVGGVNKVLPASLIPASLAPYAGGLTRIGVGYLGNMILPKLRVPRKYVNAFATVNVALGILQLAAPLTTPIKAAVGLSDYETVGDFAQPAGIMDLTPGLMDYETVGESGDPNSIYND